MLQPRRLTVPTCAIHVLTAAAVACSSESAPGTSPSDAGIEGSQDAAAPEIDAPRAIEDARPEADAPYCPLPAKFGSPGCEACISERCCDVALACDRDPGCQVVLRCTRSCLRDADNVSECIQKCIADTPDGGAAYLQGIDACMAADVNEGGCAQRCS